jgi:glycine/D-amino acid oxidase-like deaminating enzyme
VSDIVIVGGGIIACSTALALLDRGVSDIVILERDTVGSGGTGKSAGIVRCHYGVSAIARLALESLSFFEHAEAILGAPVGFEQVGYIVGVGEENVTPFRASLANQVSLGIDTREVDHGFIQGLWPAAYLDDFATFCFEPRGGYGDGYTTVQAMAALLRRRGVVIRQGAKAVALELAGDRVTGVRLADGEAVAAGQVLVAAGAWSVPLLAAVGVHVPIQPMLIQEVLIDPGFDLGPVPVFSDLVSKQYVHSRGPELLFGNSSGEGATRPIDDPDRYPSRASSKAVDATAEKALHRFPGIEDPRVATTATGVIDATPDNNPVISQAGPDGLFLAVGMSGHGFKLSPALGRLTAGMLTEGLSPIPGVDLADFRLSRFEEGDLMLSPYPYAGAAGIR